LGCIYCGFWTLLVHDTDAGNVKNDDVGLRTTHVKNYIEPIPWDAIADFGRPNEALHVIMALHPKCPCSITTLRELESIHAAKTASAKYTFLVALPISQSISWIDTESTKIAMRLPNAEVVVDVDSKRAIQLGLVNSGALLVIQPNGTVCFRGGITSGRTCSAGNPGANAVTRLLKGESIDPITTPTFGCPLQ
jgi:hypothetical protein